MPNANRSMNNQPPTGEGKQQSPRRGAANKLSKRSELLQAAGFRQNIGGAEDEEAARAIAASRNNPKRPKAER